ncbi:MAG: polysaccharide deacetylase family protein, partial [Lachnospiraceae bacterium]|nr:polysaccharide deacetylase family protein [Lachnospiraceae bacterium]
MIDPSTKDNTALSWGFGGQRDELNRPMPAINAQNKYGSLGADFIFKTKKKLIFLTFDEGYENGYTPQILDTLKKKKVKAVFFVTKPYAESNPDLVQRMIDEGHIVGNHSVHHPADGLPAHDTDYQTNEVMELHKYIKDNFDYEMYLFRYPAGIYSERSLAIVQNCNYRSVFWSFAHADWDPDKQPDPAAALKKLEENLHPGAIYLLHAVSKTNTDILGSFIDDAKDKG